MGERVVIARVRIGAEYHLFSVIMDGERETPPYLAHYTRRPWLRADAADEPVEVQEGPPWR